MKHFKFEHFLITTTHLIPTDYVSKAGQPKKSLWDRGTEFTAGKTKRFLKNNDVYKPLTSSCHPQCNGMNERTNHTIVTTLRCKINENLRNLWMKLLKEVLYGWNRTPHEVARYPTAYLMYGIVS